MPHGKKTETNKQMIRKIQREIRQIESNEKLTRYYMVGTSIIMAAWFGISFSNLVK